MAENERNARSLRMRTIALLSLLLVGAMPLPARSLNHQGDNTDEQQNVGQPVMGAIPGAQLQPTATPKPDNDSDQAQDWYDWFWPPFWSNWALAIVGLGAICVALKTLTAIERQACATEQSVSISRENLHMTERPWVLTDQMKVTGLEEGRPLEFGVNLINHGSTPALDIKAQIAWLIMKPGPEPFPTDPPYSTSAREYRLGVIPPNKGYVQICDVIKPFTDALKFDLAWFNLRLYVYGRIQYHGIFSKEPYPPTRFCYQITFHTGNYLIGPYNGAG